MKTFSIAFLLSLFFLFNGTTFAQSHVRKPASIEKGTFLGKTLPLRSLTPIMKKEGSKEPKFIRQNRGSGNYKRYPVSESLDTLVQLEKGTLGNPTIHQNFEGISNLEWTVPPDPTGDVGPNHYIQAVNTYFAVFSKSGDTLYGPAELRTLWEDLEGPWVGTNDGDPIILYDHLADRWLITQFSYSNSRLIDPQYELVAISATSDPLGEWYRYAFEFESDVDYPKYGVWPDGYYLTQNIDQDHISVLERDSMLVGAEARIIKFDASGATNWIYLPIPSDLDGPPPPSGTPHTVVALADDGIMGGDDRLELYTISVDWEDSTQNSSIEGPIHLPVASFDSDLCEAYYNCIKQKGTQQKIDPIMHWLIFRAQYRYKSEYETLVVSHATDANNEDRAGARWYELRNYGTGWEVYQQGTYAPDNHSYIIPSIAMNADGVIAMGYTITSEELYPSIRFTGRKPNDPLNLMTIAETSIIEGQNHQYTYDRWGDYSTLCVDPVDDRTFWYTNQYYDSTSIDPPTIYWKTRIASFTIEDVIPVELTTFKATMNQNSVFILWQTATETNNNGFEIERRIITKETPEPNWEKIAFVNGHGTSAQPNVYLYNDEMINTKGSGNIAYRLKQIDFDGTFTYSSIVSVSYDIPFDFALEQNYPNPFNPVTTIDFSLPAESHVSLSVINTLGELVEKVTDGLYGAGNHSVQLNASNLSSGMYFYRIEARTSEGNNFTQTRKMILLK